MYLNTLKGYATPAYSVWVNAFVQKILLGLKLQQGLAFHSTLLRIEMGVKVFLLKGVIPKLRNLAKV